MSIITTERLVLRPYKDEDRFALYEYAKNPAVGPNAGWKPHESPEESLEIIQSLFSSDTVWAITIDGRLIGSIGLHEDIRRTDINSMELGYSLSEEYWHKGIMTEAAAAVIEYGFESMKLDLIAITAHPDNKRSLRVIEKCGFIYEGRIRWASIGYSGDKRDSEVFSLKRDEWGNK